MVLTDPYRRKQESQAGMVSKLGLEVENLDPILHNKTTTYCNARD